MQSHRNEVQMASYTVTLRFQHPAWDEKDGIPFEVTAANKREAITKARKQALYDGHTFGAGSGVGRYWFTAVENDEEEQEDAA
jgi:hypothetical protein